MTSGLRLAGAIFLLCPVGLASLGIGIGLGWEGLAPFALMVAVLFVFSLTHAICYLGISHALTFVVVALLVSLGAEVVGVATGWVFGSYYYTDQLGYKMFGLVPLLVPLVWFNMTYASHILAVVLVGSHRSRELPRSAVAALAMTAWDLALDPVMVAQGHWVWTEEGSYFGVPGRNFVGWLATALTICLLYELLGRRFTTARQPQADSYLPISAYAFCGFVTVGVSLNHGQGGSALVGSLAMSGFLLSALASGVSRLTIWPLRAPAG
jgi:putative membrane protein